MEIIQSKMTEIELAQLCSVKGTLAQKNGLVRYLNGQIKKIHELTLDRLNDENKWLYIAEFQIRLPYKGKSEIMEYTNKRGRKHMAHFDSGGGYIQPVKKEGEEPIDCINYEVPNKKTWSIVRNRLERDS
jgi:hypothetical protein